MMWFNKFMCHIFGHRWRCLYWRHWGQWDKLGSMTTGWFCDRCSKHDQQQWDEV